MHSSQAQSFSVGLHPIGNFEALVELAIYVLLYGWARSTRRGRIPLLSHVRTRSKFGRIVLPTDVEAVRSPILAASWDAIASAAILSGSAAIWAYRVVVSARLWPKSLPIMGSPRLLAAPVAAKECRRSCSRIGSSPACRRIASHGRFRSWRAPPAITYSPTHGRPSRTASAAPDRTRGLRPVLLSGRKSIPLSRSSSSQRKLRISRSRQPVSNRRRMAAVANGETFDRRFFLGICFAVARVSSTSQGTPTVSASRRALPR